MPIGKWAGYSRSDTCGGYSSTNYSLRCCTAGSRLQSVILFVEVVRRSLRLKCTNLAVMALRAVFATNVAAWENNIAFFGTFDQRIVVGVSVSNMSETTNYRSDRLTSDKAEDKHVRKEVARRTAHYTLRRDQPTCLDS
jgi:hypothetical protein